MIEGVAKTVGVKLPVYDEKFDLASIEKERVSEARMSLVDRKLSKSGKALSAEVEYDFFL